MAFLLSFNTHALAQRELTDIPAPSPEAELASFQVADGFEVNLFAADPLLAKPIQMNFDPEGRLWVATSEVYPQIAPGQVANDKILVLEDTDADGRADKTTVFADGLLIPTGVEPGDGGAYVGNSTELVHLVDRDGDLVADERRVLLSGFGTEDTHHIIHTLRWAHDGMLYFNQSIYIHSHVETPYGVRRLNGGGIWRFRPETMELDVLAKGWVNPWGHHFDRYGQSFVTDGAGGEGINYAFPGAVYTTSPGAERIVKGLNPGSPKHCGLEVVDGRHLPDDWQGNLITNDFRAHRVCRFVVSEQGSGYVAREQPELIKTDFVWFRPVDVKMGPDGAIYIADWCNPIIQHGEVDFRDERRDHTHGRIWRVTAKGRPLVERPKLVTATTEELLDALLAPEGWTRQRARRVLKERSVNAKTREQEVLPALAAWLAKVNAQSRDAELAKLEALWLYQALDHVEQELLGDLLDARDHRVRAAAVRVASAWSERLPDATAQLSRRVADDHAQVRLEAVRALAAMGTLEAAQAAMSALQLPLDENLDFALWQAARDTAAAWMPALAAARFDFGGDAAQLEFALRAVGTQEVVAPLMSMLRAGRIRADRVEPTLALVASLGTPYDLQSAVELALDESPTGDDLNRRLTALVRASQARRVAPTNVNDRVAKLLAGGDAARLTAAAGAAGAWRVAAARPRLIELAEAPAQDLAVRLAAIDALRSFAAQDVRKSLRALSRAEQPPAIRHKAIAALGAVDVGGAAESLAALWSDGAADAPDSLLAEVLERRGAQAALAKALDGRTLDADAAKVALRVIRSAARPDPALIEAVQRAGRLSSGVATSLTHEEMAAWVADVAERGEAARGEAIFRRSDMACLKCHAIAGAGGQVGPDLSTIGASAQVDYLIDSILEPNKAVKENYHSVIVQTADGRLITGVKLRQTDRELVLRNAEDQEVAIPLETIDDQAMGASLMPAGLADPLTRDEVIDLVRFMSELGKVGPYATSNTRVVRRWQALTYTPQAAERMRRDRVGAVASQGDDPVFQWGPAYSTVSGDMPVDDLPTMSHGRGNYVRLPQLSFVRFHLDARSSGAAKLVFGDVTGLSAWLDGQPFDLEAETVVDLQAGRRTITVAVDRELRTTPLRLELADVDKSPARVELVSGK